MALELRRAGWPNTHALVGGWNAWVEAGLPVAPREEEEAEAAAR